MVTGQDGNLPWPAPTLKVTWFLDHLFMRDHVSSYNYYIFFVLVPMTTKRGRMVTYLEELIAIKSLKHFNFVRSRDKLKPLYLHYKSTSCHQTWCEGDIPGEAPNNKVIQSFDHVVLQGHVLQKPVYLYYKRLYENLTGWWLTLMGSYL